AARAPRRCTRPRSARLAAVVPADDAGLVDRRLPAARARAAPRRAPRGPRLAQRPRMTRGHMRFAVANAIATALGLPAVSQTPSGGPDDVAASIVRRYLPFALLITALGTLLVARLLPLQRQRGFLIRHAAVYAAMPLMLFAHSRSLEPRQAVLGAIYLAFVGLWTLP